MIAIEFNGINQSKMANDTGFLLATVVVVLRGNSDSLFPVINYRPSINLELQCYSRHVYVLTVTEVTVWQQRIHLSSPANEYCNEINLLQYMVSMEFQTTWLLDSITTFIPT